jgi:hypothetical protein
MQKFANSLRAGLICLAVAGGLIGPIRRLAA